MKMIISKKTLFLVGFGLLMYAVPTHADDVKGKLGLGFNVPGVSVKYGISSHYAFEMRAQTATDLIVVGPRLYYNYNPADRLVYYFGAEGDSIVFKTSTSSGIGYGFEAFGGAEYFFQQNLSLSLDAGPAYITVSDYGENDSGIDVVINIGVNWYF